MLQSKILTLDELAMATGRPAQWWKRHWLRMHNTHRFPRRLPGLWGWPRAAVEEWCRHGGASPFAAMPANQNSPLTDAMPDDLAAATARIEARFGIPPSL